MAYFEFTFLEKISSNLKVLGPVVIQSEFKVSTTSFISSSPIECLNGCKNELLTGLPLIIAGFNILSVYIVIFMLI